MQNIKEPNHAGPILSAHRGAADLAPENTIPSLETALRLGIPMIELDVRSSRDGVLYDLHDESLERTTDGKGLIGETLSADMDRLDGGSWFGGEFKGTPVPRIEEILTLFGKKALFYFDVKEEVRLSSLLDLVYKYGLEEKSLFWFKDPQDALKLKEKDSRLKLKVNASAPEEAAERISRFRADVVECSPSNYSAPLLSLCRERDARLMISFLEREEEYAADPEKWPADYINIDRVTPLIPLLRNLDTGM